MVRDGSMTAVMNLEYAAIITSTGGLACWLAPVGTFTGGNHRSH